MRIPILIALTLAATACERTDRDSSDDATKKLDLGIGAQKPGETPKAGESADQVKTGERVEPMPPPADLTPRPGEPQTERNPAMGTGQTIHEPGHEPGMEGAQTREQFLESTRRRLDELDKELDQLEAKAKQEGKQLEASLRERRRVLDQRIQELDRTMDDSWMDARKGIADMLGEIESALSEARKKVSPDDQKSPDAGEAGRKGPPS